MGLRGGGYPVRGMSLSGLYAIEDAVADLAANRCQQGVVVAAGSLRNFDSVVIFGKLGLLKNDPKKDGGNVNPSYGSAVLLLDNKADAKSDALAEIQQVSTRYNPSHFSRQEDWESLINEVKNKNISPDYIVTYCNGIKANDASELAAISQVFPDAELRNYKEVFGYTSKANNALDLVAVLTDKTVPVGATILLNGAGFSVGIGYMVLKKLKHCAANKQVMDTEEVCL